MHHYILFDNHTDGMSMYGALKQKGFKAQIAPTPRQLSHCCGISLIIQPEDIPEIKEFAKEEGLTYLKIDSVDNTFDGTRGKYT